MISYVLHLPMEANPGGALPEGRELRVGMPAEDVPTALIASAMSFNAFAFLFSVNTFLSLAVQSLVQLAIGEHGWSLTIQDKYCVFGAQLVALSSLYALIGLKSALAAKMNRVAREA